LFILKKLGLAYEEANVFDKFVQFVQRILTKNMKNLPPWLVPLVPIIDSPIAEKLYFNNTARVWRYQQQDAG
jgi:hypothetical protein